MRLSISITNYSWDATGADLATHLDGIAAAAEDTGVDTLWLADHLVQADPNASLDEPMLEAYTTLGYLAGRTDRLNLGTMVTWTGIRPAALLIKMVTTLDVLSRGRAWLGLGAGYRDDEAAMMGLPFASTRERFDILEDTIELAEQMWSGDENAFEGRRITVERPISHPQPITRPRVLIGGMGEKRTLPLVARHGDACNLFDIPDEGKTIRHKLAVLHDACREVGRDPTEIEATVSARLEPSEPVSSLVDRCRQFADWGIGHVVLITTGPWDTDRIATVGGTLDAVADLEPPRQ